MDMNASNDKRRIVDDDEKDIISNIPKDIIGHILSFLPINDAICTSVLSKRWELFWTSITDIRVEGVCLYFMRQEKKQCFINFMNRVLQNLSSKRIHSFTLCLTILFSEEENHCVPLPTWISSALNLGVQKLCIHYGSNKVYRFSILLFPNISLKHLDLNIGCNFIVPPSNCFKNLKILKLQHIKFIGDGSSHSEDMVLNFSVLELFDGRFCIWSNVKNIIIEAPLLESFSLVFPEYNFLKPCSPTIKICALHLKSFHYSGLLPGDIILSNPLSVVYACIEVRPTNHPSVQINNFSGDELRQYGAKACKLLKELRRVNFLKLGLYMLKFLACDKDYVSTLPVFQSLVHLELDLSYRLPSQQILLDLLHKSPNIESLELLSDLTKLDKDLLMPQSFLSNLKVVKIRCFDWNGNNLSLTKYILDNTKVLEQLTILVWKGMKRQMRKELRSPNDSNVALVQIEKTTLTSLNYYRSSFYEPE